MKYLRYLAALLLLAAPVQAASVSFSITERNGDLSVTGAGAFDLDGLENFGLAFGLDEFLLSVPRTSLGFGVGDLNLFGVITDEQIGPGPFGLGDAEIIEAQRTGDALAFAINGDTPGGDFFISLIVVPLGYESGTPLMNSRVLPDTTLSDLGLIEGAYDYVIGQNDIHLTIAQTVPVPLPAAGWLLAGGIGLLLVARRRGRRGGPV